MSPTKWLSQAYPQTRPEDGRNSFAYDLKQFSKEVGIDYLALYRQLRRERPPKFETMRVFHKMSKGQVGLGDWIKFYEQGA